MIFTFSSVPGDTGGCRAGNTGPRFSSSSWWVPCSMIRPWDKTTMLSACWMVDSRWATISMVPHRAHLLQGILNQLLGFGVDVGGCLVQNHHRRIVQNGPGKGDSADAGPPRSCCPAPATGSSRPPSSFWMKRSAFTLAADLHDPVIGDIFHPQDNVAADGDPRTGTHPGASGRSGAGCRKS